VEEPVAEEEKPKEEKKEGEEEAKVEEEKKEGAQKTKKVEKTTWDWELINDTKPIWTRKQSEVEEAEYSSFYKALGRETEDPLAHIHFTAEGEVAFKSILYVPKSAPHDMFQNYGKKSEFIKLYVRRVFITDNLEELMPKYLIFIKGVVDSDDLPLNVSRETLQQHKLLKVIKKKLVRKVIEMLKKLDKADYEKFWKEYSTNIKLGVIEDQSNRSRLAPLLRFLSSHSTTNATSLEDYISRMKEKQEFIYYIAGSSLDEVKKSPFVEKLVKRGYEVLYLPEPVDEYCIQSLPEFKSKKFANAAKEGLKMVGDDSANAKERRDALDKEYKSTLDWLKDVPLKDKIEKAVISERLVNTPCALVASQYGWSGNMERIMRSQAYAKSGDATSEYYMNQKKIFELNPRHPLVKELHQLVQEDKENQRAKELAELLFDTATLRSGFYLKDSTEFAERVERMLRTSYGISPDAKVEEEPEPEPSEPVEEAKGADEIKPELKVEQMPEAADEHEEL
jgi:heat shock protein beta